ncbi:MAG: protein-export chaperone SecB [Gammaproteobacteria bacterium]
MSDDKQQPAATEQPQQQFTIHKIYTKDISFEAPHAPAIFNEEWQPEVNLELNSQGRSIGENTYEVVLSLTVTTKNKDKTAFLVEVQQAGIFGIAGFGPQDLSHMIGSFCPNILFPYAREAISDLVTRGGFQPLLLAPVNFDVLYSQHLEQQQQAPAAAAETSATDPVH